MDTYSPTEIRATKKRLELRGYVVAGRFVYRDKYATSPRFRVQDDGSLKTLVEDE